MPPKKQNLTIRISDEDRELLELIATREMRSISNQTIWLLRTGMEEYLNNELLYYDPKEKKLENLLNTMPDDFLEVEPPEY